jgi:rare lipoprotein A (peptidoglycan hydrolase)
MLLRRTIGASLAFLVISTAAMAKMYSGQSHGPKPQQAEQRTGKALTASCRGAHHRLRIRYAAHHGAARYRHVALRSHAKEGGGPPDPYLGSGEVFVSQEIGKAAWYNRLGAYTATGERLDAVTATAAHRTLPLASFAKVTNLDSGQSLIVKINDRGPRTRRFIIDLSPRAAEELDVRRTGVATVMVEPVSASQVDAAPILIRQ